MQARLICTLALMLCVTACSRQGGGTTLAQDLKKADRVIVLNAYDGLTITVKGEQLKKLVDALQTSQRIQNGGTITATPGYTLIFFASAVHLATVPTAGDAVFYIDKTAY